MTSFSASSTTESRPERVFEFVIATLTASGFTVTRRDTRSVSFTGPGMNSTRQNPILGASQIRLNQQGNVVDLEAELGGVDIMQRFLAWFPFLLGLGLGLLFGVGGGFLFGQLFGVGFGVPWAPGWQWLVVGLGAGILPVLPWLFLSPLMARKIRDRTEHALELLLGNAVDIEDPYRRPHAG